MAITSSPAAIGTCTTEPMIMRSPARSPFRYRVKQSGDRQQQVGVVMRRSCGGAPLAVDDEATLGPVAKPRSVQGAGTTYERESRRFTREAPSGGNQVGTKRVPSCPLVSSRVTSCHLENPLRAWNSALDRAFRAARPSAYGTEGHRFESCRARFLSGSTEPNLEERWASSDRVGTRWEREFGLAGGVGCPSDALQWPLALDLRSSKPTLYPGHAW